MPLGAQLGMQLGIRESYDASYHTIRAAIKWLITAGLIETRPVYGVFVVGKIIPFVTTPARTRETSNAGELTHREEVAPLVFGRRVSPRLGRRSRKPDRWCQNSGLRLTISSYPAECPRFNYMGCRVLQVASFLTP